MLQIHTLFCWSYLFAFFTASYILPRQTGLRNLDGILNDFVRGTASNLLRGPTGDSAIGSSRGPIRGTANGISSGSASGLLNVSASGSAGGPISGIASITGSYISRPKAGTNASAKPCDIGPLLSQLTRASVASRIAIFGEPEVPTFRIPEVPIFGRPEAQLLGIPEVDSAGERPKFAGCFHPGACPGANGPTAATTLLAETVVLQSEAAPAQINPSPSAVKTRAANNQGGLAAPAGVGQTSNAENGKARPQVLPLQRSPTEQQLPTQPNPPPFAPFNSATPGQQSPNQVPAGENPPAEAPITAVAPVITIGSSTLAADSRSNFVFIGSRTLAPGSSAILAFGSTFSLLPSALARVVHGSTLPLTPAQTPPVLVNIIAQEFNVLETEQGQNPGPTPALVITIDDQPVTANSIFQFIVQGQMLAAGGTPIVVAGTESSLAPSGSAIVINGVTSALPARGAVPSPAPTLAANGQVITADSQSQFLIGGQVLSPGGSPITVSGTTYSLAPHDSAVVANGIKSPLQPAGSKALTAVPEIPQLIIDGQTAIAGGAPITVPGVPISLLPSGHEVIVGSNTEAVPSGPTPVLTLGAHTITATKETEHVIGGQTLTPGAAATISVFFISLAPGGSDVVIQGTTIDLSKAGTTGRSGAGIFTGDGRNVQPEVKVVLGSLVAGLLMMI